jgi:hypothetical protein
MGQIYKNKYAVSISVTLYLNTPLGENANKYANSPFILVENPQNILGKQPIKVILYEHRILEAIKNRS